jgi:hypothetical protein
VARKIDDTGSGTGGSTRAHDARSFVALLGCVASAFTIEGIAEPGRWEAVILAALLGATVMLSLNIANARPRVIRVVGLMVIAIVAFGFVRALKGHIDERAVRAATALLVALAPPAIIIGVIRQLRQKQRVSIEALLGALCVYVLLGMFYSFVFGAIDRLGGQPFFAQPGTAATTSTCLYYSFTTMTTVGYGDLTAASNLGHTLSISESLLGQVYLVTVLSLIVSNLGRRRPADERALEDPPAAPPL